MTTTMKRLLIPLAAILVLPLACTDFLEPLPDGSYNSQNYKDYPKLIAGYIDKAYELLPATYLSDEFIGLDAVSDDAVFRDETRTMHRFSLGTPLITNYPFQDYWDRDYQALLYVNLFLENGIGINTHYKVDVERDALLPRCMQGDAFGLRAWYHYDLLHKFAGVGTDGTLLGISPMLEPTVYDSEGIREYRRQTFDQSIETIIRDCDSALLYLPLANRDFVMEEGFPTDVVGSVRYKKLDQIAIHYLKSLVYLLWASPAYNPNGDLSRWELAAQEALTVMRFKLERENVPGGFNPSAGFYWTSSNSPEAVWISNHASNSTYETAFYPAGFNGNAVYGPTQELVDAFPMANGYPVTDPRSGYDPAHPYVGRDPRFYSTVWYDGAQVLRGGNGAAMYTFNMKQGGKDVAGGVATSPTNYYIRKYVSLGWNANDNTVSTAPHCIFQMRWTEAALIFAEAANRVCGPTDERFGLSARDALAYIRSRPTNDNVPGIGSSGSDPWLDECATSQDAFESLVRNEWRIETCFEGKRLLNLFRWGDDSILGAILHRPVLSSGGTPELEEVVRRALPALSLPVPATEIRRTRGMIQNIGWETWR